MICNFKTQGKRIEEFQVHGSVFRLFRVYSRPEINRIWLWGYIIRSPYTPDSIYLGGTIGFRSFRFMVECLDCVGVGLLREWGL